MTFKELNIIAPILQAIENEGYEVPSPIQEQAIPILCEGKDILGSAQTGTGKTLAFAVPILQGLYQQHMNPSVKPVIQALILAPTRELAEQIKESFRQYGKNLRIRADVIYGGVSQKNQEIALRKGVDVLIATPGRLMDLMNQNLVHLDHVKYLVLDEADRMLDMGFIKDVKKIVSYIPEERQTALFSATVPNDILSLANSLLKDPIRIAVTPVETTLEKIKQTLYYVSKKERTNLLIDLLVNPKLASVLVFTRTKHGANKLVKELLSYGVKSDAIHGNKSQNNRQRALTEFKNRKLRVLVATDIAARGIDIDELSHVINYDLPETPETYIHRIGRTGRAGLSGEAISFCHPEELSLLKAIEKHIKQSIPVVKDHMFHQEPQKSSVIQHILKSGSSQKTKTEPNKKSYRYQTSKNNASQDKKRDEEKAIRLQTTKKTDDKKKHKNDDGKKYYSKNKSYTKR
jgi:ATP-dependent RNA helicase RhlE